MRKPNFCICENKDADQLRGNREADQRLCFRYTDSTIPLLPKSEISSLLAFSVTVQPGLCRTWSETPKAGFLRTRLNYDRSEVLSVACYWCQFQCCIHLLCVQTIIEPRCEKTNVLGSNLTRHKPGCTAAEDG